ncbi:hypothetical protein [Dictyobacter arantiisoli]|uniref:Uncharacterized protein n=1 Tax=Dictyobacter arantiisoli TaxID=2014874 RepID=A0A5A5TG60_9CHLR|nr:hypothetical protein [Dictyobacter arantiisoli]GCF10560.1 hypothetical protein KDI_41240 [Dictyobacter arantiisoli]
MTYSHLENIDVRHVTTNQPFYASTLIIQQQQLVVALYADSLATAKGNTSPIYRVKSIGGEQQPGESIWDCALREAQSKLKLPLKLLHTPITYFHDVDDGDIYLLQCIDSIAPLLLERQSNLYPYASIRPGLPAGPYTYGGLFLAQPLQPIIQDSNIGGLLSVPLVQCSLLLQQPTLEVVLQQGASLLGETTFPLNSQIRIHPWETLALTLPLLERHPEVWITSDSNQNK